MFEFTLRLLFTDFDKSVQDISETLEETRVRLLGSFSQDKHPRSSKSLLFYILISLLKSRDMIVIVYVIIFFLSRLNCILR